jgi:hypothetical protein
MSAPIGWHLSLVAENENIRVEPGYRPDEELVRRPGASGLVLCHT